MCCRHADRGTCGTWSTRTWSSCTCGACFRRRWPGVSSGTCTWRNRPRRGCCLWRPGNVRGGVVPRPANEEVGLLGPGFTAVDCCAVVADELQAEFIYEHVEGAKAVAGPGVRSVGIHDDVGIVGGPDEKLHEEPARPAVVASCLVQACDLVVLVHGSHVPETRVKVRVPAGRTFMQDRVKRNRGPNLPGVVHHKLWRGQLREPVPHTPVHGGRSPRVVVVAQEVDGLAVLPGDGTQSSPAPEFVPATFGQPPAEFLGVVLAAWHDGARGRDSQLFLQHVEERD